MTSTPVQPKGLSTSRAVLWVLLCCVLTACAARPMPRVDSSRASVLVVRGYLESANSLERQCEMSRELAEVAHCVPRPTSVATFVIEESFVGAPAQKRVRVRFTNQVFWPELKLGSRYQYLAVLATDGSLTEMVEVKPLARTAAGDWALRVSRNDYPEAFPCSRFDAQPESMQFPDPAPAYSEGWDEIFPDEGVRLRQVAAAYEGNSAAEIAECH